MVDDFLIIGASEKLRLGKECTSEKRGHWYVSDILQTLSNGSAPKKKIILCRKYFRYYKLKLQVNVIFTCNICNNIRQVILPPIFAGFWHYNGINQRAHD